MLAFRRTARRRRSRSPRSPSLLAAFAELDHLERLAAAVGPLGEVRKLGEVGSGDRRFPLYELALGTRSTTAPAVGFFAGVHGLERIGTQVVLAFLDSLLQRLPGDEALARLLGEVRLVFMPLVNPAGMSQGRRSNARGVDLMRNAPLDVAERAAFLVGGHRWSPRLPWYRGRAGSPMELEARALCDLVGAELLARPFSIALDCHSGFGLRDRLWFPHAHTRAPFARIPELHALFQSLSHAAPGHPYLIEPQSRRYLAHGDLWDYLAAAPVARERIFLPITLEMGSWRWIRKAPRQALSRPGFFNPLPQDRAERVKRNHAPLLSFLCEAARRYCDWLPTGAERARREQAALAAWFA